MAIKRKIKRIKTPKEIRDRLEKVLKDYEYLKNEFNETPLNDKYIVDICDDMTYVDAEIKTLRWVLGEQPHKTEVK